MDKKIIDYIEKELKKGFKVEQIKRALVKAGHNPKNVNEHINFVLEKNKERKIDYKKVIVVVLVVAVILFSYHQFFGKNIYKTESPETLGYYYLNKQNYDKAIEQFNKAIQLNPNSDESYIGLGWAYWNRRKNDQEVNKAIEHFNKAIELNVTNANAYLGLGFSYMYLPKMEAKAIGEFNRAIQLNPSIDVAYSGLGWAYEIQKEYDKAIESVKKAIELNLENEFHYQLLGDIYIWQGQDYIEALKQINKAFEINPNNYHVYSTLGVYYISQEEYNQALEHLNKALELRPNNIDDQVVFTLLGFVYLKLGEYDKSLELYKQSLTISVGNSVMKCMKHSGLGLVYYYKKEFNLAKENWDKVEEMEFYCDEASELKEKLINEGVI